MTAIMCLSFEDECTLIRDAGNCKGRIPETGIPKTESRNDENVENGAPIGTVPPRESRPMVSNV